MLRVDIQEDEIFISRIESHIKSRWNKLTEHERAVMAVLIKALNDRALAQATTPALKKAIPSEVSLEMVINKLRQVHKIPIILSSGRGGGYRLPLCRSECNFFLDVELSAIFRKIGKLMAMHASMAEVGVTRPQGMDGLVSVYKMHALETIDSQRSLNRK